MPILYQIFPLVRACPHGGRCAAKKLEILLSPNGIRGAALVERALAPAEMSETRCFGDTKWGCAIAERFRSDDAPSQTPHKGDTKMKLTKNDIKQKRAELVEVLLKIEKLKNDKSSIEKTLAVDFEQNETAYRNGITTENGVLIRKPNWKTVAKPVVEAA